MIISLLLTHFIGDFLLQPRWIAINKSSKLLPWSIHTTIIVLSLLPCTIIFNLPLFVPLLYGLLHGIQDAFIWRLYKYFYSKRSTKINYYEDHWFYTTIGFDQFLHLSTLFFLISIPTIG